MQENSGYTEDGLLEYLVRCSRVIAVVKLGVHNFGTGNGTGSFVIEIWSDAAKLTEVRVAAFRQS